MAIRIFVLFLTIVFSNWAGLSQSSNPKSIPKLEKNSMPRSFAGLFQVADVKGKIRNKALYLPKPEFSYEAISAGIEGKVRVVITITEEGLVESAKATSGSRLLYSVCEEMARRSTFRPFRVDDKAIRTEGELVYDFIINKTDWLQVGYEIGSLAHKPSLRYFPVSSISKALDPDWKDELELARQLDALKRKEVNTYPFELPNEPFIQTVTEKNPNGSMRTLVTLEKRPSNLKFPTSEQVLISEILISALNKRLTESTLDAWLFRLGIELSSTFDQRIYSIDRSRKIANLVDFLKTQPVGVDKEIPSKIENVISLLKEPNRFADIDLNLYKAIVQAVVALSTP